MDKKPDWIVRRIPAPDIFLKMQDLFNNLNIHTICESASCPNMGICFEKKVATFLILGNICSRNCKFCGVQKGIPLPIDKNEPFNIAKAVEKLQLKHVVITSVTRDDLQDQGVNQFIKTIEEIKRINKKTTIEVLIPDFKGNKWCLNRIIEINPEIINHNIETVQNLYPKVRPEADFKRSLEVLGYLKKNANNKLIKTGMMIGLGESDDEIFQTIDLLSDTGCDILTIGQYLQPSKDQLSVKKYYHPKFFEKLKEYGLNIGFKYVYSGPFVRSSFNAKEIFDILKKDKDIKN
ncbi:MAG: lipoyl synthase [Candidatus Helarchaeota archaeon]